jgi:hypothetical protein
MTGQQYTLFLQLLSRAAQLAISDMGTSTAGEVATAALDAADQLVVCTEMRRDALEVALEWISALAGEPVSYRPDPEDYSSITDGRYAELVRRAIVVVAPGGGDPTELQPILDWMAAVTTLGSKTGRVVVVPHDGHIATGGQIRLASLQPATQAAYLQVAAHVVDNFGLQPLAWRRPPAAISPVRLRPGPSAMPAVMHQPVAAPSGLNPAPAPDSGSSAAAPPVAWTPTATQLTATALDSAQDRAGPRPVGDAADFALGRRMARVLGVGHTEGELCVGCTDPDCRWPIPAGTGQQP